MTEPQSGGQALTRPESSSARPNTFHPSRRSARRIARADIYAAGVEILLRDAGQPRPFESEDKVKIVSMHLAGRGSRDVSPSVNLPAPLEQAVLQAMEKSRDNRLPAAAFMQALDDAEVESRRDEEFAGGAETLAQTARPPGARRGAAAALALLVVAVGGLTIKRRIAHHRLGAGSALAVRPVQPAPPPPNLAAEMKKVEAWLEDDTGRVALEAMLTSRPKDARVSCCGACLTPRTKHQEALDDYAAAIALNPGFRGDPVLLGHVDAMLAIPSSATRRSTCSSTTSAKCGGRPPRQGGERGERSGAATPGGRRARRPRQRKSEWNRVSLDMLELRKAPACEEKKDWVEKLRKLGNIAPLPHCAGCARRAPWGERTSAA